MAECVEHLAPVDPDGIFFNVRFRILCRVETRDPDSDLSCATTPLDPPRSRCMHVKRRLRRLRLTSASSSWAPRLRSQQCATDYQEAVVHMFGRCSIQRGCRQMLRRAAGQRAGGPA